MIYIIDFDQPCHRQDLLREYFQIESLLVRCVSIYAVLGLFTALIFAAIVLEKTFRQNTIVAIKSPSQNFFPMVNRLVSINFLDN